MRRNNRRRRNRRRRGSLYESELGDDAKFIVDKYGPEARRMMGRGAELDPQFDIGFNQTQSMEVVDLFVPHQNLDLLLDGFDLLVDRIEAEGYRVLDGSTFVGEYDDADGGIEASIAFV